MLRSAECSSHRITQILLERIDRFNPVLNAFLTITAEEALRQAEEADSELAAGVDRGPLHGIPIAVKDLIATKGIRTTAGTLFLRDWIPDEDADVVTKLRNAGAVNLGKTGLDELAWGTTSANPHYGAVRNPWNTECHPGGSSGGSAAAVAAGLAFAALGTDTACSIRQPAHCCGIVGFKPTYGIVSTRGIIPLVPSMDHAGPLARSVADCAIVFDAITRSEGFSDLPNESIAGRTIGLPRAFFFEGGCEEVVNIVLKAVQVFRTLGAEVREVELPDAEKAFDAAGAMFYEVLEQHGATWRKTPQLLGPFLQKRMKKLSERGASEYESAVVFQKQYRKDVDEMMRGIDVILAPTSTVTTGRAEEGLSIRPEHWKNASIFNLTGLPSISLPCGFTKSGLPVGLMMTGRRFADKILLQIAAAFEKETGLNQIHPAAFSS